MINHSPKSPGSTIAVYKKNTYTGVVAAQITPQFSLEKDVYRYDFTSLLFYLGLLTIKEAIPSDIILHIPNDVIRGLY
ncbi:MAG TPA: hypothetical protein VN372_01055 [Methanospirillum sp.]|nr:hypothetical protein [Methanospirillum sp.]